MNGPDSRPVATLISSLLDREIIHLDAIQELWSGYGAIYRVHLDGGHPKRVVVKHVAPPNQMNHPRGWNSTLSHERKLHSYAVERQWYLEYAPRCTNRCRVPKLIAESCEEASWLFVFEDLDAAGFSARRHHASSNEIKACLSWLAAFHAAFMGVKPEGLWEVGTYWHLATRPDELNAIRDGNLTEAAPLIDERLNQCRYQTLVHGDAKIANFCFPPEPGPVSAVDFQYVGGGCGMKDVAYFLSSCLTSAELETEAESYLEDYFRLLRAALDGRLQSSEIDAVESEWRGLYSWAWADFFRFLAGWSPQHWKIDRYSERLTREVLARL